MRVRNGKRAVAADQHALWTANVVRGHPPLPHALAAVIQYEHTADGVESE